MSPIKLVHTWLESIRLWRLRQERAPLECTLMPRLCFLALSSWYSSWSHLVTACTRFAAHTTLRTRRLCICSLLPSVWDSSLAQVSIISQQFSPNCWRKQLCTRRELSVHSQPCHFSPRGALSSSLVVSLSPWCRPCACTIWLVGWWAEPCLA